MRATNGVATRRRRKAIKRKVEGSWGTRHSSFKVAKQTYIQNCEYAYIGRKQKKRDFRKLWINRINAACKSLGITYSKFINLLNKSNIKINRKMLSELAISNPEFFKEIVNSVKK
jgi:large subunit ribosomal protein L20